MASGAVRWFSPITMSVGSKMNTWENKLQLRNRKPFAKDPCGIDSSITMFSTSCKAPEQSGALIAACSAAYGADRESFNPICLRSTNLASDHDHDRT
jgi:hypothetical protein